MVKSPSRRSGGVFSDDIHHSGFPYAEKKNHRKKTTEKRGALKSGIISCTDISKVDAAAWNRQHRTDAEHDSRHEQN